VVARLAIAPSTTHVVQHVINIKYTREVPGNRLIRTMTGVGDVDVDVDVESSRHRGNAPLETKLTAQASKD